MGDSMQGIYAWSILQGVVILFLVAYHVFTVETGVETLKRIAEILEKTVEKDDKLA